MAGYKRLPADADHDYGGVHYNSGIINHAAYLMADGFDALTLTGLPGWHGRDFLGELTYDVLTNRLYPTSDFQDARDAYLAAVSQFVTDPKHALSSGEQNQIVQVVRDAWHAVGLTEGVYNEANIKSARVAESKSGVQQIIYDTYEFGNGDNSGWVLFFVPYGTNVSAIEPDITVSEGATYSPQGKLNFAGPDRSQVITVSNASGTVKRTYRLTAVEEPILRFSATAFQEANSNDGTIGNVITIDLVNDEFTGFNGENFVYSNKVTVTGVPAGLNASVTRVSKTRAELRLTGKAILHASADNISGLKVQFKDDALTHFYIEQLTNAATNLRIDFKDPSGAPIGGGFMGGFMGGFVEATEVAADAATGVTIKPPNATPVLNAAGESELIYDLSADDLKKAFGLLKEPSRSIPPMITIAAGQGSDRFQVKLPASAIQEGAISTPEAKLVIASDSAAYELPVSLLDLEQLAQQFGVSTRALTIMVSLNGVSGDVAQAMTARARQTNLQLVGDAIDFVVEVSAGGKPVIIDDFGSTYVERSITVPGQLSAASAVVLRYDPGNNRFSYLPGVFQVKGNQTVVTFSRNGNSIYTVAKFTKIFADVGSHWAKADIERLAARMIVSGYTDTEFAPNRTITRAEFAAILARAMELSAADGRSIFSDVQQSAWYAKAVEAAVNAKLVRGYEDGTFRPGENITREQMAVMIAGALDYMKQAHASESDDDAALAGFHDAAAISAWARSAVAEAAGAGIISGSTDGSFHPAKYATRAEAAVMIRRLLDKIGFQQS